MPRPQMGRGSEEADFPEVCVRARRSSASALAALVLAAAVSGCGSDSEQPREGVRTEELTNDASGSFDLAQAEAGQRASLRVTVERVLSPNSFVVPAKDTNSTPLLVVAKDPDIRDGAELQVSGQLQVFEYDDLSAEYQLAAQSVYADFDGELVLVAQLVDGDLPLDDK